MGIVGIVAGRLADKYGRPAFVVALTEPEAKGSARAGQGSKVHIVNALEEARSTMIRFGGHAPAAGFSVDPKKFAAFRTAVQKACAKQIGNAPRVCDVRIDAVISPSDLSLPLTTLLERLEPCGQENQKPTLALMGVRLMGVYPMGAPITTACVTPGCAHAGCTRTPEGYVREQPRHTRLLIKGGDGNLVSVVAWNSPDLGQIAKKGDTRDLVFGVEVNEWNGSKRLQLRLIDQRDAPLVRSGPQRGRGL